MPPASIFAPLKLEKPFWPKRQKRGSARAASASSRTGLAPTARAIMTAPTNWANVRIAAARAARSSLARERFAVRGDACDELIRPGRKLRSEPVAMPPGGILAQHVRHAERPRLGPKSGLACLIAPARSGPDGRPADGPVANETGVRTWRSARR